MSRVVVVGLSRASKVFLRVFHPSVKSTPIEQLWTFFKCPLHQPQLCSLSSSHGLGRDGILAVLGLGLDYGLRFSSEIRLRHDPQLRASHLAMINPHVCPC